MPRWLVLAALATLAMGAFAVHGSADEHRRVRVSKVADNAMPVDIVQRRSHWNFGPGSLWTHQGWQYAAYWDDARQVSVARRELPHGPWEVVSLPDYRRGETGERGRGGKISRGFGDGHEKVALGISADGVLHLSFDHHLSTLRYRTSTVPVAADPAAHDWHAALFGPVQNHLGGPRLEFVTYPRFYRDGSRLVLYLRLGGGSGAANSHYFTYEHGRWTVTEEPASQLIDQHWSGGDGTVNAYTHALGFHQGRWHLTWCWRDTPDDRTCHDLCYAYSDDYGNTWQNNDGRTIGITGSMFISADSPGVAVWRIPPGTRYRNGGSMTVDRTGRVHVLMRGERAGPVYFTRDPDTGSWYRKPGQVLGKLAAGEANDLFVITEEGVYQTSAKDFGGDLRLLVAGRPEFFEDCSLSVDRTRLAADGWVSVIGQQGKTVRVVDYQLGEKPLPAELNPAGDGTQPR
jgi:hypothetical protein